MERACLVQCMSYQQLGWASCGVLLSGVEAV
jgi:hypothetical protein